MGRTRPLLVLSVTVASTLSGILVTTPPVTAAPMPATSEEANRVAAPIPEMDIKPPLVKSDPRYLASAPTPEQQPAAASRSVRARYVIPDVALLKSDIASIPAPPPLLEKIHPTVTGVGYATAPSQERPPPGSREAIAALHRGRGALRLAPFEDTVVDIAVDQPYSIDGASGFSGRAWLQGRLVGSAQVTISDDNQTVVADFDLGTQSMRMIPLGNGINVVVEDDPSRTLPPHDIATVDPPPAVDPPSAVDRPVEQGGSDALTSSMFDPDPPALKVAVFYTAAATASAGNMAAYAGSKIDGVAAQVLANTGQAVPYQTVAVLPYSGVETNNHCTDINNFGGSSAVTNARNQYHPDLILLYGRNWSTAPASEESCLKPICGTAATPNTNAYFNWSIAYSLVDVDCEDTASAHELGHNMALHHNTGNVPAGAQEIAPDDRGWRAPPPNNLPGTPPGRATVMSYVGQSIGCRCDINWQYSDPTRYFPDTTIVAGDWAEANAARILGTLTIPVFQHFEGSPFGAFDASVVAPGALRVTGWSKDYDHPNQWTQVIAYVDGVPGPTFTASINRPDVGAHGFSGLVPISYGTHTVCTYGLNLGTRGTNGTLGCGTITLTGDAEGGSDLITGTQGAVRVRGWTIDPDTVDPTDIHVYSDGAFIGSLTANQTRTDVAAIFPDFGSSRGFDNNLYVPPGNHLVCTYAINKAAGGGNTTLGCATIFVGGDPFGGIDGVTRAPSGATMHLRGWAIDPDTTNATQVHVYVNTSFIGSYTANALRADVGAQFPHYGNNHGYDITWTAGYGTKNVCIYVINSSGTGSNQTLGCRTLVVSGNPIGSLDTAVKNGAAIRVTGWTIDLDSANPTLIHIYVDGVNVSQPTASLTRNDVAALYPGGCGTNCTFLGSDYGAGHGFDATVPTAPGLHSVCVYAINLTGQGTNPLLSTCRNVTV